MRAATKELPPFSKLIHANDAKCIQFVTFKNGKFLAALKRGYASHGPSGQNPPAR